MRRLDRTRSYAFVAALFVVALFGAVTSPVFADDGVSLASDATSLEASAEAGVATESGSTGVLEGSSKSAANVQPVVEQSAPLLEVTGLNAQAHVQGRGWLAAVGQGSTAGTTGQSRLMFRASAGNLLPPKMAKLRAPRANRDLSKPCA